MKWLLVVGALAGCQDHLCDGEKPYCTDNVLHTCDDQHDNMHWEATTCTSGFCIETGGRAFCASEDTPRAACDGVAPGVTICDGAQRVTCTTGGYATVLATCPSADLCQPSIPVCTVLPGPIAQCMARMPSPGPIVWPASFCMGNTAYRCLGAFAYLAQDCGLQQCRETAQYGGCTTTATDPVCTDAAAVYPYGTCDGNIAVKCLGSYRLPDLTLGCGGGTCVAGGGCQGS